MRFTTLARTITPDVPHPVAHVSGPLEVQNETVARRIKVIISSILNLKYCSLERLAHHLLSYQEIFLCLFWQA